jgi:hypothetical protein
MNHDISIPQLMDQGKTTFKRSEKCALFVSKQDSKLVLSFKKENAKQFKNAWTAKDI